MKREAGPVDAAIKIEGVPSTQILAKLLNDVVALVNDVERERPVDRVATKQVAHHFFHNINLHAGGCLAAGQCRQCHQQHEMHI